MTSIGTITIKTSKTDVPQIKKIIEWKLEDFPPLSSEESQENTFQILISPEFVLDGYTWTLRMSLENDPNTFPSISLYLQREQKSDQPVQVSYSFGVKNSRGDIVCEIHRLCFFHQDNSTSEVEHIILRSYMYATALPYFNSLTIFCSFNYPTDIKCTSDVSLYEDYKKMLSEVSHHDLIVKVGSKEFKVHRDILKARSPVFRAMLNSDMKEKNNESIDILDCSPSTVEQLILYIYSGNVEFLDQSNVLDLYYIADKYDVKGLREECKEFITKSLTCTNICDVLQIAMNHSDSNLLEKATEYFRFNMTDIVSTNEWQDFMKNNPTVADELLDKATEN